MMKDPIAEKLHEPGRIVSPQDVLEEMSALVRTGGTILSSFDSEHTFWNGVKIWVGNNEYEPPNDGYHLIVKTPEGNMFTFNLRVEDGKPIVEQMWCE